MRLKSETPEFLLRSLCGHRLRVDTINNNSNGLDANPSSCAYHTHTAQHPASKRNGIWMIFGRPGVGERRGADFIIFARGQLDRVASDSRAGILLRYV